MSDTEDNTSVQPATLESQATAATDADALDENAQVQADQEQADQEQAGQEQAEPELTEDEKFAKCMEAVNTMVSQRQTYYKLLRLVSTVNEDVALKEAVGEFPEMKTSIKTPGFFIKEMVDNFALKATPVYEEQQASDDANSSGTADQPAPVDATDDVSDQAAEASQLSAEQPSAAPAQPQADAQDQTEEDSAEAQAELEAEQQTDSESESASESEPEPSTYTYEITEVGKRVMAALSPSKRLEHLYAQDADRAPAFDFVLQYCVEPRKRDAIEGELKSRGFITNDRMGASFFVDRLERAGGLVWEGGWSTTKEGRDFLDQAV